MKKYVKNTIAITAGILIVVILFMIVIDPLFQYHYPWFGMKPNISTDAQYYVAGMAKNFDYDNVIVGTSMSQNFRASWFDKEYNGKTAKLTIGGLLPKDYDDILKLVLSHGKVKRIFMDLSNYYLISDQNISGWGNSMPTYLYNKSVFDDMSYLLNKDLLIVQGSYQVFNNISGSTSNLDEAFCWDNGAEFSGKKLQSYLKETENQTNKISDLELKKMENNFNVNIDWIYDLIEDNPNVEFIFFIPPYSSAFWYLEDLNGTIKFWNNAYIDLANKIVRCKNAKIFYFYNDENMKIEDWNMYRDVEHYNTETNKFILKCFTCDQNLLKDNTYRQTINNSFKRIKNDVASICLN